MLVYKYDKFCVNFSFIYKFFHIMKTLYKKTYFISVSYFN